MFKKITEIDLEKILAQINFETLSVQSKQFLSLLIKKLKPLEKQEILTWIHSAQKITSDDNFDRKEKLKKLKDLGVSDVTTTVLKSVLDNLVESVPLKNKNFVRSAISSASVVGSFASKRALIIAGLSLFAFKQLLPQLLLSQSGQNFINFLKTELEAAEPPQA